MHYRGSPGVYSYHRSYHRPYRIFWFVLGGAVATLWIKHKEVYAYDHRWGHCVRVPVQPPPSLQTPKGFLNTSTAPPNPADSHPRCPMSPRPLVFGNQHAQAQRWEEDKARMLALSRHAGDAMADLLEATLDSILSTVKTLRAKLVEHRAQRDWQKKHDEELEARKVGL